MRLQLRGEGVYEIGSVAHPKKLHGLRGVFRLRPMAITRVVSFARASRKEAPRFVDGLG